MPLFNKSSLTNNELIIQMLDLLMTYRLLEMEETSSEKEKNKLKYSALADQRVIQNIKEYDKQITSGEDARKNISGVGKGIAEHIDEILEMKNNDNISGIHDIDDLSKKQLENLVILSSFMSLEGVGIKKAEKYLKEGYSSVEELKEHLKSSGTKRQKEGTKYIEETYQRIPREEIDKFKEVFYEYVEDIEDDYNQKIRVFFTGSYRRGLKDSGDIDILIAPGKGENERVSIGTLVNFIIDKMKEDGVIISELSFKEEMFQGIVKLNKNYPAVRIDIMIVNDKNELPYALLYFTGNKVLNTKMRSKAHKKGYHLTNTEMTDENGNKIIVKKEKEIFQLLNMKYLTPEERNL